jgi:threonyl-tRNA synthetase
MHRAVLGSVERFMAILVEHTGGKWPFWCSPRQVIVCPISEKFLAYSEKVYLYLHSKGYHVTVDRSNNQFKKKIRNAQLEQWNYILVCGADEEATGTVTVRTREGTNGGQKRLDDLNEEFQGLQPPKSDAYKKMYAGMWSPADCGEAKPASSEEKPA